MKNLGASVYPQYMRNLRVVLAALLVFPVFQPGAPLFAGDPLAQGPAEMTPPVTPGSTQPPAQSAAGSDPRLLILDSTGHFVQATTASQISQLLQELIDTNKGVTGAGPEIATDKQLLADINSNPDISFEQAKDIYLMAFNTGHSISYSQMSALEIKAANEIVSATGPQGDAIADDMLGLVDDAGKLRTDGGAVSADQQFYGLVDKMVGDVASATTPTTLQTAQTLADLANQSAAQVFTALGSTAGLAGGAMEAGGVDAGISSPVGSKAYELYYQTNQFMQEQAPSALGAVGNLISNVSTAFGQASSLAEQGNIDPSQLTDAATVVLDAATTQSKGVEAAAGNYGDILSGVIDFEETHGVVQAVASPQGSGSPNDPTPQVAAVATTVKGLAGDLIQTGFDGANRLGAAEAGQVSQFTQDLPNLGDAQAGAVAQFDGALGNYSLGEMTGTLGVSRFFNNFSALASDVVSNPTVPSASQGLQFLNATAGLFTNTLGSGGLPGAVDVANQAFSALLTANGSLGTQGLQDPSNIPNLLNKAGEYSQAFDQGLTAVESTLNSFLNSGPSNLGLAFQVWKAIQSSNGTADLSSYIQKVGGADQSFPSDFSLLYSLIGG